MPHADAVNGVQVEPAAANKKARLLIPDDEVDRVMNEVAVQEGPTGLLKLAGIKNIVEGWYVPHAPAVQSAATPLKILTLTADANE